MDIVIAIVGGFGIGAIVSQIIQYFLVERSKRNDRRIEELKEAFSNLLATQAKLIKSSNSQEHQIGFELWEARVQLIGSLEVIKSIEVMKYAEPNTTACREAMKCMLEAMRVDLDIAR